MYLDFRYFYSFFTKREKLIYGPGNHVTGNTAKFWRDGKKRIPDSDSATQNCMETSGFASGQKACWPVLLISCAFIFKKCNPCYFGQFSGRDKLSRYPGASATLDNNVVTVVSNAIPVYPLGNCMRYSSSYSSPAAETDSTVQQKHGWGWSNWPKY